MLSERLKAFGAYGGAAVLSLLIVVWVMQLWKADLAVPFSYDGDALVFSIIVKGTIENRTYYRNPSLGMPAGMEMYDFPYPDAFNLLLINIIFHLISGNYATVLNLFFLLTFPLTALTSVYVLRQFDFSYFSAVVWSLIYATHPFHFLRGQNHLFVMTYYFIPLAVMVALWICSDEMSPSGGGSDGRVSERRQRRARFILSVFLCLLISSAGQGYHQFFACFFLFVAGLTAVASRRHLRPLLTSWILIGVTFAGFIANLTPALIYIYTHGKNKLVATRFAHEAEYFGLKIAQMLLPVGGHRIPWLAGLRERYNFGLTNNENDGAALGTVGAVGFLILLGWFFYKRAAPRNEAYRRSRTMLDRLSLLNISGVLFATVGGFSSLFALLISPQIRSYNRISIFIGFFCILAVASLLEDFSRSRVRPGRQRLLFRVLLASLLVVAVLDQTSKSFVPNYARLKAAFNNDADFVRRVEASTPARAMIFQLPYVPFPENPVIHRMSDYDHFRGYLHSRNLRWSYGATKGREGDDWQRAIASKPTEEFVEALVFAGFSGIYLNRDAYPDDGAGIEAKLSGSLGASHLVSGDGRLVFFSLAEFSEKLAAKFTPEDFEARRVKASHPLLVSWKAGFSGIESTPDENWRWCSSEGELLLSNLSPRGRKVTLEMSFATGHEQQSNLTLSGGLIKEELRVNSRPRFFSATLAIPPGRHAIKFVCDAERVDAPLDPRHLVFKVSDFRLREW